MTKDIDLVPSENPPNTTGSSVRCRANSTRGTTAESAMSYRPVSSVQRAFQVLRALNELGAASVGDLHRKTKISKPTIVRMLETLISDGYVVRDNFLGGYSLTAEVQQLSVGYDTKSILIEASRTIVLELAKDIKWPISLATHSKGDMVVNYTSNPISPMAYPFSVLHMQLQMCSSAFGRCYFAFSDARERAKLLRRHKKYWMQDGGYHSVEGLVRSVDHIRAKGYALSEKPSPTMRFIAVPILDKERCVSAMGLGFFHRAVPTKSVEETIIEPLRQAANRISQQIERR